MGVDRTNPIPYYIQVANALRERIHAGEWHPGDQLPGEMDLCRHFAVSRPVIRQALNQLLHEGLVMRQKGKGTFVSEPKIHEALFQKLTGFYQDMIDQGYTPVTQVRKQHLIPASSHVASQLGLAPGSAVIEIERLRFVQADPIVLVSTFIPQVLCPALLSVDLSNRSLYAFLGEHGLHIVRGQRTLEAVPAPPYEAHLLGVPPGTPMMLLNSVGYLSDGTPLEYYYAFHRGDRSRFDVELVRGFELSENGATPVTVSSLPPSNRLIQTDNKTQI